MNLLTRMDPRTHVLVMSASVSMAFALSGQIVRDTALAAVYFTLLGMVSRYRFLLYWTAVLAGIHGLLFGVWIYWPGTHPARISFLFALILRKLFFITCTGVFLISTVSVDDCIKSLEKMRMPWAVIMPAAICLRFLPTLAHEGRIIRDALKVRGLFSPAQILARPLRTGELFFCTLMFRSLAIGEELAYSVSTRAGSGSRRKAYYRDRSLGVFDMIYAILVLAAVAGILILPWPGSVLGAVWISQVG